MMVKMSLKNPYKNGGMFEGANPLLFKRAKELRKHMTASETVLWMHLKGRDNKLNFKFRRQHPIGSYVADFYCHKAKLIIEVDGSVHNSPEQQEKDKIRQADLESWGYCVLRFSNKQVLNQVETVLQKIKETIIIQIQNASSKGGV
jgi:cyclase